MRRETAVCLLSETLLSGYQKFGQIIDNDLVNQSVVRIENAIYVEYTERHLHPKNCPKALALQEHCENIMFYRDLCVDTVCQLNTAAMAALEDWYATIMRLLDRKQLAPLFSVFYGDLHRQENFSIQAEEDSLSAMTLDIALERMDGKEKWKIVGTVTCGVCGAADAHLVAKQIRAIDEGMDTFLICQNKQCKARYPV